MVIVNNVFKSVFWKKVDGKMRKRRDGASVGMGIGLRLREENNEETDLDSGRSVVNCSTTLHPYLPWHVQLLAVLSVQSKG